MGLGQKNDLLSRSSKAVQGCQKSLLPRVIAKNILFYPIYKRTVLTEYKCTWINLNVITERTNFLKY